MLIVVSGLLLVLGVLAYRRQLRAGDGRWLLLLRLAVVLGFAAILIGQVMAVSWVERPRRVVFLTDVSASMMQIGADSAVLATARSFPLPERVVRDIWRFADSVAPQPDPGRTRIARALLLAGRARPAAVFLLSDGQENGEGDAVAVAREIGVPVYSIGFGAGAERNLAVAGVSLPAEAYAGDTVSVGVRVMGVGLGGDRARVRLAGSVREAVFGPGTAEQEVEFRVFLNRAGRQVLEVRADSLDAESNYADNLQVVPIDVRPARVRVLYITNRPGPGTRFVLRALAGQARTELAQVVATTGGFAWAEMVAAEVRRADVIVLDGAYAAAGDAALWSAVADRVRQGAGMLVLAGSGFGAGATISELLPLEGMLSLRGGMFTPGVTADGTLLPWFQTPAGIDIGTVPPFTSAVGGELRPDATVWLAATEDGAPLVVAGRAGRGRVVMVTGDPLWRWGFAAACPSGAGSPLEVFVEGLVRYLAESDTAGFRLESDRSAYRTGERIRLTLRARAADGSPWTGLDAFVAVGAGEAELPLREIGAGRYEGWLDGLETGRYRITASARWKGTEAGRTEFEIEVAEQSVEMAATGMNRALLEAVARAGGGRFFTQDSLPQDGSALEMGVYRRSLVLDPRRTPWLFAGLALLVGAELVLRRRAGLL